MGSKRKKLITITGTKDDKGRLTIQDFAFIDTLLRTNDKELAYKEAVTKTKAKGKSLTTLALRMLQKVEIQNEIKARYDEARATKPWLVSNLMDIAKKRSDKGAGHAVNAMRLISELGGHISNINLNTLQLNNIVVKFPVIYSKKEADVFIKEGRVCE